MRVLVRLVLLLFVFFLSTPTIVGVIKKTCDTSCFYSMSEEELAHKEVKAELKCYLHISPPVALDEATATFVVHPQTFADSFSARILIPPPEQV